jgi:vancomycin resistance protein YoaR
MAKKAKTPTPKRRWILGFSIVGILLLALAASAAAYQITQLPESAFVPYFEVKGVDLSGITTFHDAEIAVNNAALSFLDDPVTYTSERGELTTSLRASGVDLNTDEVISTMVTFMNSATPFEKIRTYLFGQSFRIPLTVDELTLKAAFADSGIEQGLKNASYLAGQTVSIDPEQIGYGVDTITLAGNIEMAWLKKLNTIDLPLLTSEPTITSAELTPLLAQAQAAAAITFSLTDDYGNTYDLPLTDHMDWLIPGSTNTFGLQQEKFITTVQTQLAPDVEEDPAAVTITQNEDGTYAFEGSARFGQKIDTLALQDTLETALQTALAATDAAAPAPIQIPVTRTLPEVTVPDSLKVLGVTDLVGVGYSDFSGSPSGRVHNINEGINQFNGVLIQKDAEFSFMDQLSPVDAEHGFLPELVIKGDETIPEYGGGMCQVSSTMFRAALYSGLPITARTNHSYAVSYYARPFGYGLDATVYDPKPDFKFLNDTPGAMLVQAYTEGDSAYYVFYGTNDGRRVTMEGPRAYDYRNPPTAVTTYVTTLAPGERKLKEHSHRGFQVDWTRTITKADGTSISETIHSDYEARPEKWEEGTADATTTSGS